MYPSYGKNVIAVGACESFGDDLRSGMLGHDYMADFSSVGPSFDGRIKVRYYCQNIQIVLCSHLY